MPNNYKLKIRMFLSHTYTLFLGSYYTRSGGGDERCFSPSENIQVSCENFYSYSKYWSQNLYFNQLKYNSPCGKYPH